MYWCRTDSEKVNLSEEHLEYKWVTAKEAPYIIEKPGMKADIESFMRERRRWIIV